MNVTYMTEYLLKKNAKEQACFAKLVKSGQICLVDHSYSNSLYDVVEQVDRLFRLQPDRTIAEAEKELRSIAEYLEWLGDMAWNHEINVGPIGPDTDEASGGAA